MELCVSQLYLIHVIAKPGREEAINAIYRQEIGEDFLIWTKAHIAARIREVNAGKVEALSHLRGKLESIGDWNRQLPEMAEGHGSILIADSEATLTPKQLLALRKYVLFIEKHKDEFSSIDGMQSAQMLLGGAGRKGIGVVAPEEPASEIYILSVRYKRLELWTRFYRFRADPSRATWTALRFEPVPWRNDRTVDSLVKSLGGVPDNEQYPSQLTLRRALLPKGGLPPDAVQALKDGVVPFKPRDKN